RATASACSEKIAKLTPSPSQVAPSGYGRPGHTIRLDCLINEASADAYEFSCRTDEGIWARSALRPACLSVVARARRPVSGDEGKGLKKLLYIARHWPVLEPAALLVLLQILASHRMIISGHIHFIE